jgi:hypothetical protein
VSKGGGQVECVIIVCRPSGWTFGWLFTTVMAMLYYERAFVLPAISIILRKSLYSIKTSLPFRSSYISESGRLSFGFYYHSRCKELGE